MRWWIWVLILIGQLSFATQGVAEETKLCKSGIRILSTEECVEYPIVEFWMLRENLCRLGTIQGEQVLSITSPLPCPTEELKRYLQ